jgi:hypothetical protein
VIKKYNVTRGGEGVGKVPKKYHVSFEWPFIYFHKSLLFSTLFGTGSTDYFCYSLGKIGKGLSLPLEIFEHRSKIFINCTPSKILDCAYVCLYMENVILTVDGWSYQRIVVFISSAD